MAVQAKYTDSSHRSDVLNFNSKTQDYSRREVCSVYQVLKKFQLPSSAFICTSGTAGKLELSCEDPESIRLCLVCDESEREKTEDKVRQVIQQHFKSKFPIEWRDPSHQIQVRNKCFPSHFLHQILLCGDRNQVDQLYYQFVKEVQEMSGEMRQKFRKHFVSNHLAQLSQVINGEEIQNVDLKKGIIVSEGLKYSLLLPIQYVMDLRIIDAIRVLGHWPKDYVSFLKLMPTAIPNLIKYMYEERLLPELSLQDVEDLQYAYQLGLFYVKRGQKTECTPAEKAELLEAYTNTQRILGKITSGPFCKNRGA